MVYSTVFVDPITKIDKLLKALLVRTDIVVAVYLFEADIKRKFKGFLCI